MNSKQLMITIGTGLGANLSSILGLKVKDVYEKGQLQMPIGRRQIWKTYVFPEEVKQSIRKLIQGKNDGDLLFSSKGWENTPEDFFLQEMLRGYEAETGDKAYGKFLGME